MELFKLDHVEKMKQKRRIIKHFTARVKKGEILTIIGPSGSGKSTLLSLFNRLIDPDSGIISLNGQPLINYDVLELRRRIGMVFQQPIMLSGTVLDNLLLGPSLHGQKVKQEKIEELFHWMKLDLDLLNHHAIQLSGGEKQRVALARQLLNEPEVLLLDEVTASLDAQSTADIESYIARLNKEKEITILWITHNIEQARRIGHYTWVVAEGMLAEEGKTAQLFYNPTHPTTQSLLSSFSKIGGQ